MTPPPNTNPALPAERPPAFSRDRLPSGVLPPEKTDPGSLGDYRVVGRIGAGGMGAVYAGITDDGRCAAVKVVHPQYAADPEFRARFAREVAMVARVRATCAPAFLGADVASPTPWLATEYVPGDTLRAHVRDHGTLTGGMLDALAAGLAEALVAVHAAGVVHRDLKPGNVILSPDGPRVLDFGIARATDGTALTATGGLFGTPGWVSPEQYEGAEATERSDMFAWAGLVLYAATGREPFGRGRPEVLSHRTRNEEPDLSGLPEALVGLVGRAFAKDPAARPTASDALAELTDRWNSTRVRSREHSQPTHVLPELLATEWRGISAPEQRPVRGRGRAVLLSAGAAALAAAVITTGVALWPVDEEADPPAGESAAPVSGPAVRTAPEDWQTVFPEVVAGLREAESFEVYQNRTSASAHGSLHVFRYTQDPVPVFQQLSYGGPYDLETLAFGEGLENVVTRNAPATPTEDLSLAAYVRAPEQETDPVPQDWVFLDDLALLSDPGTTAAYQGETDPPERDTEWVANHVEIPARDAPVHHYTGTYVKPRSYAEPGAEPQDLVHAFDLWVDGDGGLWAFESSLDQVADQDGFADSWELVVLGLNHPVEIEIPDESEIGGTLD